MTEPQSPGVTVYTDGGADPNPGFGGWAAILIDDAGGAVRELSGGEPHATNNRMELTAAIRALESLRRRCRVRLYTDSSYLRKGVSEWLPGWIERGFRRKTGELQNEDLWRRLAELVARHEIEWKWVKGHAGDRYNERADRLASEAIRVERRAAGGDAATSAAGAAPPVDAEVFLRVSCARGRGGWAALLRQAGSERTLSGSQAPATPNQLDLAAALAALESLPAGIRAAVYTGSDYLRNGASRWLPAWQRRGWKTQEGQPVQNRDLWQRLASALAARSVTWPSVKEGDRPELEALAAPAREAARGPG
jgi:ribonuclease HI